jgi:hypothetical protein
MTVEVIRANGTEETHVLDLNPEDYILGEVHRLINCDCVNIVNLRIHKQVMLVDDNGYAKQLPFNAKATKLYHSVCHPGTTSPIVGDVVLVKEEDFQ